MSFETFDALVRRVIPQHDVSVSDVHSGILDQVDYNQFWSALCVRENATKFMCSALDAINAARVRAEDHNVL